MRTPQREQIASLLSHFDSQEAAMLAMKSLLLDIGRLPDDDATRRQIRVRIDAASELCTRLHYDCVLLIQQLAITCQVSPREFSARSLIVLFSQSDPSLAQSLRSARRRLLRLAWQIQRISANTSWILAEDRNIRHSIFEYAGGVSDSDRYDASGRKAMSPDSIRYGTRS